MMAAMPGFWKLYYDAVAAKADYQPADPNVLRQNMVDKKAALESTFEPASNQFAQDYGVAGMSVYHVVIGADGKPSEIAVAGHRLRARRERGRFHSQGHLRAGDQRRQAGSSAAQYGGRIPHLLKTTAVDSKAHSRQSPRRARVAGTVQRAALVW